MKSTVLLAFAILLFGCQETQRTTTTVLANEDFHVELLFEIEGCKMYRFRDNRAVYWSDCRGKVQSSFSVQSGKAHITYDQETITTE
jgi:GH24 family phage-related lysozyme (muramidase)